MFPTFLSILMFFLIVIPFWKICEKMGYPGWFGIGAGIPIVNVLLLFMLAFSEWPLEREAAGGVVRDLSGEP